MRRLATSGKEQSMATKIRSKLSKKNRYWIPPERYYELKHFCLQYPIWKKAYAALDGLSRRPSDMEVFSKNGVVGDPTARCAEARSHYLERMKTVEQAAIATDAEFLRHGSGCLFRRPRERCEVCPSPLLCPYQCRATLARTIAN